ncbi:MAG: gliding motility-associated C-terminal domain-containing protein [Bacteroidota bacterium]
MLYRLFPFTILMFGALAAFGQLPQNITLTKTQPTGLEKMMACDDQFAGTFEIANFVGQSNTINKDTSFLCLDDRFEVIHNGDADLTGDPDPTTTPGVTYILLDCPPTVDGPDLDAILMDNCLFLGPPAPTNGFFVTAAGDFNGDQTFNNPGSLQATYNNGDPLLLWFAPITIDHFSDKRYENDVNGVTGPCVHLNEDEAFAVVYLNAIELSNLNNNSGTSGCSGSVVVEGGLSEFDDSNYDVFISLEGNPSVQGTVTNGPVRHGETIEFDVPVPGLYNIVVEDGKSCGASMMANMIGCINVSQSIGSGVIPHGEVICLDVTVGSGFQDIQAFQYAITFDPTVLQFTIVQDFTPLLPNFNMNNFNIANDTLRATWLDVGGATLPDSTVVFQVCFEAIGMDGECSEIAFSELGPITDIEIIDINDEELGFNGISGLVCISSSALQATSFQDSVSCAGDSDGGFSVIVSGGTPPYSITWQNLTTGGPVLGPGTINVQGDTLSISGLPEGEYIITITDDSPTPNTTIEMIEILGPPMLNILFDEEEGQCAGDPGSITANLVLDSVLLNDVSNYAFNWSNGGDTPTIDNIPTGNYSLTVTDNTTGCVVENMTFLFQLDALDVQITIDSATCTGIADGVISVDVSGGTTDASGNYSIELGASTVMGTSASLMAESGEYELLVTDANGCTFEQTIDLPAIKVLSITPEINNVSCNGSCDGSIFALGTTDGGTPAIPYSFVWSGTPNPPPANNDQTFSNLNNLCVGTYTVVMTDTDGCEVDSTFEIIQPAPLELTLVSVSNETCQPGMDGSITVAVSGGAYPYEYDWNDPNTPLTDSIASNLSAGIYTVAVTDSEGCVANLQAEVTAPDPPVILALEDDTIDCPNDMDGTLTVVPADPGSIVQTTWSNGEEIETIINLGAGEYIVTITDGNACTAVDTALVIAPPPLVLDSVQLQSPSCVGGDDGEIIVNISGGGGVGPYNFTWEADPAVTGAAFIGAPAGEYTISVTDANDCQPPFVVNVTLEEPPFIEVNFSAIDSASCASGVQPCDGSATVTANYSDGSAGIFDFTWLGSGETDDNVDISTASLLCQGDQLVQVADQNCVDTFTVAIPSPPPILPGQSLTNVSCFGFSDGAIMLTPSGGVMPYNITWSNGAVGPVLTGLPPDTYTAQITDANGCAFNHLMSITEPSPLELMVDGSATTPTVSCVGDEDGTMGVIAEGGNITSLMDETYIWQNNVGALNSNLAENLAAGTYSVTVVDPKGCEADVSFTIEAPDPIEFILGDVQDIPCFGGTTSITVDSAWGGTGIKRFRVNAFPPPPDGALVGEVIGGLPANEYLITVFDVEGCSVDTTVTVSQPPELQVTFFPDEIEIELGDSLTELDPVIIPPVPIDTFIWTPSDQLSCADCKNPVVNPTDDQLYTLVVVDINGCTASGSIFVDLDRNRNVYIPNIFSPNGDGINDDFQVHTGPGVTAINFVRIYDRWGDLVHDVEDPIPSPDGTAAWDGTFRGDEMNPAVFLYLIEVEFLDGQVLLYRGDITLVK